MNRIRFLCLVVLCGIVGGCAGGRTAWNSEDAWYHPLPEGTSLAEWQQLDRERVHEVTAAGLSETEGLLQDVPLVELTREQAASLIATPLADLPGTKPFLVRGLLLNRSTGGFAVYVLEDQVVVYHRSLGGGSSTISRQPLVLQLEQAPTQVYVAVSMAK